MVQGTPPGQPSGPWLGDLVLDLVPAIVAAAFALLIWRRNPGVTPAFALDMAFAFGFALRAMRLLPISALSATACTVTVVGLSLLNAAHVVSCPPGRPAAPKHRLPVSRFTTVSILLVAMGALGLASIRRDAAISFGAADYAELTPYQIRAAELSGAANSSAILVLAFPALTILGVIGFRLVAKPWLMISAIPLLLSSQSTNRTSTYLLGLCLILALIATSPHHARPSVRRFPVVALFVAMSYLGVLHFNSVGGALNKDTIGVAPSVSFLPEWTLSLLLYVTGGPSALSVALGSAVNPWSGSPEWSYYAPMQALSFLRLAPGPHPLEVATVQIPIPFNMYTGFGDVFFGVGPVLMIPYVILLGIISGVATRASMRGALSGFFLRIYFSGILAQFYFSNSVLLTSTVVAGTIGVCAFWSLTPDGELKRRSWVPATHNPKTNHLISEQFDVAKRQIPFAADWCPNGQIPGQQHRSAPRECSAPFRGHPRPDPDGIV